MKDLVQIDADTAMLLYSKGLTHLPVLKRDGYSSDWTAAQPLYLDDIIEDLMIFVSDSERNKVLNPPKVDVAKVKEEIAMTYEPQFRIDPEDDYEDDDPDWMETEPSKPEPIEAIPDDDAVPELCIQYEKPEVITVEQVTGKTGKPPKWNILRVNKLSNEGWTNKQIADEYGVSEDTVRTRLMHYRAK